MDSIQISELKVKLSLLLIKHDVMKKYGKVQVSLHAFLTPIIDGGKLSVSCFGPFTLG
jgi:hypothetical protein